MVKYMCWVEILATACGFLSLARKYMCWRWRGRRGGNDVQACNIQEFNLGVRPKMGRFMCMEVQPTFGGVLGPEVYDPELNTWSSLMPNASGRICHQVATFGNKVLVCGGRCVSPSLEELECALSVSEVYDPNDDVWTVLGTELHRHGVLFEAHGKTHLMTVSEVYVLDTDSSPWEYLHSNSFATGITCSTPFDLRDSFAVGAEVFMRADFMLGRYHEKSCLLRSTGFGGKNTQVVWNVVSVCPGCLSPAYLECMGTIQL